MIYMKILMNLRVVIFYDKINFELELFYKISSVVNVVSVFIFILLFFIVYLILKYFIVYYSVLL